MVINESPASSIGTHWVAVYGKTNEEVYYFDSFGEPPNEYLKDFLTNFTYIHYNNRKLQNVLSDNCGNICITFIILMSNNVDFYKIVNYLYTIIFDYSL